MIKKWLLFNIKNSPDMKEIIFFKFGKYLFVKEPDHG